MKTEILQNTENHYDLIAEALRQNQVCALPTETVYGLAGNIRSEDAISKIFKAKNRPSFDPLIVHIPSKWLKEDLFEKLESENIISLSEGFDLELSRKIASLFFPGPLTLILPKHPELCDAITGGNDTVAIRIPDHEDFQAVLDRFGDALAAPSANRFGHVSPTKAEHVVDDLDGKIPFVLDGGTCKLGLESTVVRALNNAEILRPGSITQELLETELGVKFKVVQSTESPGNVPSHYSPKQKVYFIDDLPNLCSDTQVGVLLFENEIDEVLNQLELGADQLACCIRFDEFEPPYGSIAQSLYQCLRTLEKSPCDTIIVEKIRASEGFAPAILNRLERAAAK